jgi:hypothetical protein
MSACRYCYVARGTHGVGRLRECFAAIGGAQQGHAIVPRSSVAAPNSSCVVYASQSFTSIKSSPGPTRIASAPAIGPISTAGMYSMPPRRDGRTSTWTSGWACGACPADGRWPPKRANLAWADRRTRRSRFDRPQLTVDMILAWADAYFAVNADWPTLESGPIADAPGENWTGINHAL